MGVTDYLQPFLPLLFCGDEVSDILYLFFNWDSFASINLRNASLAFVLINGIINFLCAILVSIHMKGCRDATFIKSVALLCCCGWVPVLALLYLMLYFKVVDLAIEWNKADILFD